MFSTWTWIWIGVSAVVQLATTIAMLSSVYLHVHFSKLGQNDRFHIRVKALFGLIKLDYEVPKLKLSGLKALLYEGEMSVNGKTASVSDGAGVIDRRKIMQFFEQTKLLLTHTEGLNAWTKETMRLLKCTEFRWTTRVGLNDAPETAVLTGLIWALKSSILHLAAKRIRLQAQPVIHVFPLYNRLHFTTEFLAEGHLRAGSALWAGLKLLRRIAKAKEGLSTWRKSVLGTSRSPEPS
ncbi:DUF2953 domain-containing protein [Paenibacillus sp. HJGM_3]|uniref:DUF2953 domain-containing protein n=1 Tax=Paenibacillus sp. HJGM_3 TaxID=3379816 RepID=UPI00385B04BD